MTLDLYGRDHRKTFIILLLAANLLLLLALFAQISNQRKAADRLAETMNLALAEQQTKDALDRLARKHEVVLRERLQARLEGEEARGLAAKLTAVVDRQKARVAALTDELAATRAERDEQQAARIALERRLSDALDLLATHDELKTRAGELDAARADLATATEEYARVAGEVERLRRQVIVLDRLVKALKSQLKVARGS